ncbi:zinc-finger domain-containing protein [Staphylococcus argensis]|uniref:Zinc-finger domain-containing protein n=1 Tax=Staphylococcus argensis TaxID=1607738 RepID=A0A2K4FGC9_9STAP|nr:zinc-finger domain-containing protein [Staphylococcus argensis]MCY6990464.1 zinc-finger domain-containing protein [Staphylococcus argensis]POA09975.1 zinc-finger domain-containing protein [Staphylococcus argensis]
MLSPTEQRALNEIDQLMNDYCKDCILKTHLRKTQGKNQAHYFCINECSIGKEIKQLGNELQ